MPECRIKNIRFNVFIRLWAILALCPGGIAQAADISLALPVKCKLGVSCFIQNYVDHDPSENARDFKCGRRTYNGHDGTDIRIRNLEVQRSGVEVLAAAPGRVTGIRNGMEDVSVRVAGKAAIMRKECGNGAVIEHGDGWSTQYCHLAKFSLVVKQGDFVAADQQIGLVGLSGDTEFFHLHFTVRHQGKFVDPFAYGLDTKSCEGGRSLWRDSLRADTTYRSREILDTGFADVMPSMETIESGELEHHSIAAGSDALVAYVRAIGLQAGDQQSLRVEDPSHSLLAQNDIAPLDTDKAQYVVMSGKKRKEASWLAGTYTATYQIKRDGIEVLRKKFEIEIVAK